jgi:hypothetical protein
MYGLAVKEISRHKNCDHSIYVGVFVGDSAGEYMNYEFNGFCFVENPGRPVRPRKKLHYDAVFGFNRFVFCQWNHDVVKSKSPWLAEFCKKNDAFFEQYENFFENRHRNKGHGMFNQWSILNGITRLQQPDACRFIGIDYATPTFLNITTSALGTFEKFGLRGIKYVTIQRGVGIAIERKDAFVSTRLWPVRHFVKFAELFHARYPDVKIVQLGCAQPAGAFLRGVDIDLTGKTSMEEAAVILKHALFHLDGDCGMVHVKRWLNGRSIVLLGTTPAKLLGYPENINLTGPDCSGWCEWISKDWYKKCMRGFKEAPCMVSITSERVMEAAGEIIDGRREYVYRPVEHPPREDALAEFIGQHFKDKNSTIVDIFNRNGWDLARKLRVNFDDITMFRLDCKFDSFSKAKSLGLKLEYGCIYNVAMADNSCDAVVWQSDNPDANVEFALEELFRILKPGGLLLLSGITADGATASKFGLGKICAGVNAFTKETVGSR